VSVANTTMPATAPGETAEPMLEIGELACAIETRRGRADLLQDVSVRVARGTTLGIVGESGSGKSMLIRSILGLAPAGAGVSGTIALAGRDLGSMRPEARRRFLGRHVGVVFQNPMTSLNPVVRIGRQIAEAARFHLGQGRREGRRRAIELLESVGIPDARTRVDDYPHQFSGGMRQRIMIAMALACEPELFIADEATTALDVTVQREILDLLARVREERGMTMILVSHDLGIVAGRTDHVAVMYAGRIVEAAPTGTLFQSHRHRYTEALLSAIPRVDHEAHVRLATIPGQPPSLLRREDGCPFAPRCAHATAACASTTPPLAVGAGPDHTYRCLVPVERPGERRP
jgi:peptide/nickel transport system ATP-binding protein